MTAHDPAEVVIGLDVGTTATKAVAFGPRGWHRAARRSYPLRPGPDGRQEQDPAAVAEAVVAALADCVDAVQGRAVTGIAVSTAMHALLGLDERLTPRTPLVTWADGRAAPQASMLADGPLDLHRVTGTPMHPMAPVAKLAWFAAEQPDLAATVRWWVDLKAWVLVGLTGTLATDTSSASGSGLVALATGDYHPAAVDAAGTSRDHLPDLVAPTTRLALDPGVARRVGLPTDTPVVAGAADGPLANLGAGAIEPGVVGLSLGTSAAVRTAVTTPPDPLDPALFCYHLAGDRWIVGGALSTGGLAAAWAADALAPDLAPDVAQDLGPEPGPGPGHDGPRDAGGSRSHIGRVLDLAATAPPGCDGLVMVPALLPPRAPTWDPTGEGAWLGLGRRHTRAHLVRSAVEGVARDLADVTAHLDALHPVLEVRATGGAFASPLWQQVVAATLDRPVTLVGGVAGTALGAAALGWWALGRADDPAAARAHLAAQDPVLITPDPALVAAARQARDRLARLRSRLRD